ncbi:nucleoside-diphosphate kinase [Streptomyces sp. SM12]|uniref:nucleoside-diphosphate kinase n=1 Tax=Streptomyces sp. SM12 TaxID=1071602 RepID=UPI0015E1ACBC|nr:nucleoside-diphosphate kinase [Streptomyces sp. SM12]
MPAPATDRLTREPEKARHYAFDPLVRGGWATLVGVLGEGEAARFASETALLWVRPDAVAAGVAEDVLARVGAAGFTPVGASAVRLERAGVRALWWWHLRRATAERLLLLDAVVELGPGLLVLYRHSGGDAARRLTSLKGGNDPAGRRADSLRSVAGSPNRLLTMVHTSDDPLDVVRELAVFLPWRERAALVASAHVPSPGGSQAVVQAPLAAVLAAYPDPANGRPRTPSRNGRRRRGGRRSRSSCAVSTRRVPASGGRRWSGGRGRSRC